MTDDDREARMKKLPKWAQDHVADLERRLERQTAMAARGRGLPSPVAYGVRGSGPPDHYVPEHASVRFRLDGKNVMDTPVNAPRLAVRLEREYMKRSYFVELNGAGALQLTPWSTNVIHVRVEE